MNYRMLLLSIFRNRHFLLIGSAFIAFFIFHFILNFNGLYGQDSHAYYQYSLKLGEYFQGNDIELGYFFWPKLFPFMGAALAFFAIPELLALQLISLFALVGSLLFSNKLIQLYYKKSGVLFLLLTAGTQIYFLRGGFLVMSDMLACFFCIGAFYYYSIFRKSEKVQSIFLFFLFATLAFFTRYACVVVLTVPTIHLCYLLLLKLKLNFRFLVVFGLLLIAGSIIYLNGNFSESIVSVSNSWSAINFFSRNFSTADGSVTNFVPNGLYVLGNFFHFGYLSFGVLLIPFYARLKNANRILMLLIFIYLFFLAGHPMQNYRFLLIIHPFVLLLLFPAFNGFENWLSDKRILGLFICAVLLFNIGFSGYSFQKTWKVHSTELEIVNALKKISDHETIYSFYVDQSFASYGINNKVENFFYKEYQNFEHGSLVVFNEDMFKNQWKDHRIMKNWNYLNENYSLDTLSVHSNNWIIYRIN